MKRISTIAVSFIFTAVLAVSAFSQASAAGGPSKVGWIDTGMFGDDKEGVTKYINALKALDAEMKPRVTDLQTLQTKLKAISDELTKMSQAPNGVVKPEAIQAKQEEGQILQREFEFKKKEYDAAVEVRSPKVLGPVSADISKAIQEYAKVKGFTLVLDIAAFVNANAILALDPASNVTKDFIVYYNARPATATATAATPK